MKRQSIASSVVTIDTQLPSLTTDHEPLTSAVRYPFIPVMATPRMK